MTPTETMHSLHGGTASPSPQNLGGAVENAAEPSRVEEVKTIAELPGRTLAPLTGSMKLYGTPAEIGETIASFLGDKRIHCRVEWEVEL